MGGVSQASPIPSDLPNVWGQGGALFAFSGFDGKTDRLHPFVCSTSREGRGLDLHTDSPANLSFALGPGGMASASDELVTCDAVSSILTIPQGEVRLRYVFLDGNTIIGEAACLRSVGRIDTRIGLRMDGSRAHVTDNAVTLTSGDEELCLAGEATVLEAGTSGLVAHLEAGQSVRFALVYSHERASLSGATNGISADIDAVFRRRLAFFDHLPEPPTDDAILRRTYYKCTCVQKVNCCSAEADIPLNWTTPDRWPHRNMWLWDSAFHALGLRHFAPEWARNAIKAVLSKQKPDGFVPHMMTPDEHADSQITQPPILSWAAWEVYERVGDERFLEYCYPRLKAMVLYDCVKLDPTGAGLAEWESGGASGMDNSPRFDQPLGATVDLNAYLVNDMEYLERIALQLALDDEAGMWAGTRSEYAKRINARMWDATTGFYYDRAPGGEMLKLKTEAGFMPLFAGICTEDQSAALVSHLTNPDEFGRAFPVPSVSADDPAFSDDMWRGPVWVNYNYMIIRGLIRYGYLDLAADLRNRTLVEIARWYAGDGVIYEFYDCEGLRSPSQLSRKGTKGVQLGGTWVGRCIKDYHWTAALFLDLILNPLNESKP